MNDDLVERLKVHGLRDGSMKERLLIEARDELTRLRKENHDLRGEVASLRSGAAAREERA